MTGQPVIRVEDLATGFDGVVQHERMSFQVGRGEVFGILGGSGSGKSVLMKNIIGLFQPLRGRILIEGDDIVTAEGDARRAIQRKMGVMFQGGALFGSMTLLQNVRLPLEEFTDLPDDAIDLVARMKLALVDLAGFESYRPADISGGMAKRAAIARAMALDPGILLLDEPSAGLDPITSAELDRLILRLARSLGVAFVVVTHELPSIFAITDRVIMLEKGVLPIVAEGRARDLKDQSQDPWVRAFFHREPQAAPEPAAREAAP